MKYRADIDGLRAIAVLSVFLFHLGIAGFSGGFVGVDIFFVISGYVIARSIEDDLDYGRFSVWRFYNKRIRRIFPALFATLVMTWAASYILLLPEFFKNFSESFTASAAFVSNIYFWREWGYFSPDSMTKPLLHTWSLSVEEQYYIFAPLFTWVIYSFFHRKWRVTLLPLLLISLGLSIFAMTKAPTANFYLLPTRAWELLLGALLAHSSPNPLRSKSAREILGVVALCLIACPIFLFSNATPFPGYNALPPCLGAAILIYLGQSGSSLVNRAISIPVMTATGKISYSLYLIHWPLISFAYFIYLSPPNLWQAASILWTGFILAYLSWRFVEQPFRLHGEWHTHHVIGVGLGLVALFSALGYAGVKSNGWPTRFPDYKHINIRGTDHRDWKPGTCFLEGDLDVTKWKEKDCTLTHGGKKKVLLWGDSFAGHYVPGILANRNKIPYTLIQYSGAACPPMLDYNGFASAPCRAFNSNALKIIREHKIDMVILSGRWMNQKRSDLVWLQSTLDKLDDMKIPYYVIGQSPEFPIDIQPLAYYKGKADMTPVYFDGTYNDYLLKMVGPERFINPMTKLCARKLCQFRDGEEFLYQDADHFSAEGSRRAVLSYFPMLK